MLPIRNTAKIYVYQFLTFGFYFFYWCQRAGREANQLARQQLVLSAWWLAVPAFGGYWWVWHYGEALHNLSQKRIKKSDTFLIYVIATCLLSVPLGVVNNISPSSSSSSNLTHDETRSLLIALAVALVLMYLISILAIGAFMAITQKKLNTVFGATPAQAQPVSPQPIA